MRALANEIAKNLVLAGIGSLTVQDSGVVVEDDLGAHFFVSEQDIGKNVRPYSSLHEKDSVSQVLIRVARRVCSTTNTAAQPKSIALR